MRITVEIEEIELDSDYGGTIPGLRVICGRCGHEAEVYGTDEPSIRRGCVMLREECPNGESNFYAA
jgi:hypothetical protein